MSTQTIAAFDLGIKNLSYCVAAADASGSLVTVKRWANLNLLADGADSQSQTRCGLCHGPASFEDRTTATLYCKKCAKKSAKPFLELADMKLKALRDFASCSCGAPSSVKTMKKAEVEALIAARRLMPYKAPKAKGVSLQIILAGMEKCLDAELEWLAMADRILIENQPSEFAPHMKSVQMMLFALVDHRLRAERDWTGTIEFVHAKKKTAGSAVAAGKENKRARKLAGIGLVRAALVSAGAETQLAWWETQAKKDDLADAMLMCLDGVATS